MRRSGHWGPVYFRRHSQNLNLESYTNEHGGTSERPKGPMWRHGRAWLHLYPLGDPDKEERAPLLARPRPHPERCPTPNGEKIAWPCWGPLMIKPGRYSGNSMAIGVSWKVPGSHPGASIDVGGYTSEDDLGLHLGLGLFDVWLQLENILPRRWLERPTGRYRKPWPFEHSQEMQPVYDQGREISLRFFGGAVWWKMWAHSDEWHSTTPRWQDGNWHPLDTFCGQQDYHNEVSSTHRGVLIPLPEGVYLADVTLERATWTRKRWPWWPLRREVRRANVEPYVGLPIPGKGENSWDCEDDALFELTTRARTVEHAVARTVERVLDYRRRYNGTHAWPTPAPSHDEQREQHEGTKARA